METKSDRAIPFKAVHPGEILREELKERGIKQKDFAKQIGVQATHLNEFIHGKRNLNSDLAMKLEVLGIPYTLWMNFHNGYLYEIKGIEKKQAEEQEAHAYETECEAIFNLKLLYKKLGFSDLTCRARVRKLKETFKFDLLSSSEMKSQVAGLYRHSMKVQIDDRNMLTWLLLSWLEASRVEIQNEYKKGNGLKAAEIVAAMANSQSLSVQAIKDCLNQNGIMYVNVEKLDKVPVDAYSSIVNGHPCITVTYRYNDIDKLAFDILHELCHIEYHLSEENKAFISIEGTLYSKDPREREANEFAKNQLISEEIWNKILSVGSKSLSPHKIVKAIATEAEKYGISPSIAVARYKHDANWYQTSAYKSPKIQ